MFICKRVIISFVVIWILNFQLCASDKGRNYTISKDEYGKILAREEISGEIVFTGFNAAKVINQAI